MNKMNINRAKLSKIAQAVTALLSACWLYGWFSGHVDESTSSLYKIALALIIAGSLLSVHLASKRLKALWVVVLICLVGLLGFWLQWDAKSNITF
ncbi:hypothetical protein H7142_01845 [Candidatus Saccharibacteria bacterium]|nr:hypothetical protein [Candidatus Saccharibacteria bacterium]